MNRHADMDAEQLMQLAFDRSQTGRGHLAGAVTDMLSGSLNLRESDLIADILLKLVQGAEIEVRRKLAQRLAGEANAPHDLIAFLANDEIKVAHPVLVLSQVLTDTDLLKVISKRSDSHCHAIARRKELSVQVTSALVESGDPEAIRLVLINEGAELAAPVLKWLADLAKHNESIRNPLIRRKEITSDLAIDLYWWVSVELRHYILERYQIPAALIDEALEMTVQQLINTSSEQRKVTRQMRELAFQLSEADKITPQLLIQVLRTGLISFFSSLFVAHTGLDETIVDSLLSENGGERLAVVCRWLDIGKSDFASIFLLARAGRPGEQIVDPRELSRVLRFFDRTTTDMALSMVRGWRDDPASFLKRSEG